MRKTTAEGVSQTRVGRAGLENRLVRALPCRQLRDRAHRVACAGRPGGVRIRAASRACAAVATVAGRESAIAAAVFRDTDSSTQRSGASAGSFAWIANQTPNW